MVAEDRKFQAITEGNALRCVTFIFLDGLPNGVTFQSSVERLKCEESSSCWVQSPAVPATHRDQYGEVLWVLQGLQFYVGR